ncbi:MAG: hypothetical protein MUC39_01185 [Candidatus Omnitrophica bacterium]|nr:hypothetical protein [Candidatus Omnitrophota bacterium]
MLLVLCLGLCGCVTTSSRINNISLGMTKANVLRSMGTPTSTSAKGTTEYLTYKLIVAYDRVDPIYNDYFVKLIDGKVESYGKVGDFDSVKNPTNDINLNVKSVIK